MEDLIIAETGNTPSLKFDMKKGLLEIKGRLLPENPFSFFEPLILLLEEYLLRPCEKTTVNLQFYYLNSSSSKRIFELLKRIETLSNQNKEVVINWYYEEEDEYIFDDGEVLKSLLKVQFNLVPYQD